ncbi:hypothetical protein HY030_03025 [Candidatus Gottesmanbacteria bacterium]|nr:hypothetical protein [Candidatus Gottesmanbacteria bacterium]
MRLSLGKLSETREFLVKTKKPQLSLFAGRDKIIAMGVLSSFLLILVQGLFLLLVYRSLPSELPLFYSRPLGQEQLGSRFLLWMLPVLALILFLLNLFIAKKLSSFMTLGRILIFTGVSVTLLLLITQFKIITS